MVANMKWVTEYKTSATRWRRRVNRKRALTTYTAALPIAKKYILDTCVGITPKGTQYDKTSPELPTDYRTTQTKLSQAYSNDCLKKILTPCSLR